MFFKQIESKVSSLAYLFGCGSEGLAVAVDVVAGDELQFLREASNRKVRITHVIDTHVHADHISGGRVLADLAGARYCLHERARTCYPYFALKDDQEITIGNVVVRMLHTPGHTDESMCLLVSDRRRGPDPWFVLTGDTLLVGAVGRPDLAGREREMAGQLFDSLQDKLLLLPNTLEIYPGHQAGSVCGAGLSGKPSSTLGFERRFNPGLQFDDRTAFIDYLTRDIPPRPAEMERIIAANTAA